MHELLFRSSAEHYLKKLAQMLLGIGAVAANIVLNLLPIKPLVHGGLALSREPLLSTIAC
jgi:hypothetical protein